MSWPKNDTKINPFGPCTFWCFGPKLSDRPLSMDPKSMIIQLYEEIFYNSYIHCYHGLHLLNEEKCGDAVKFLQESKSEFIKCEKFCKQYRHGTLLWSRGHLYDQGWLGRNRPVRSHLVQFYAEARILTDRVKPREQTGSRGWSYSQTRWIDIFYQLW